MKKLTASLLPALVCIALNAGNIVTDSIDSKILGAEVKFNVYLPDGFDKNSDRYPVVYLLHGLSDDYRCWDTKGALKLIADELINSGEADRMVIVTPNAGDRDTRNVWNGYFNMPGWSYEDFFFNEFMPFFEGKYRAVGDKAHRAVMGLSMGGGGSVVYCQHHPELFSSCFAMSPWLDNKGSGVKYDESKKDKRWYVCESVKANSAVNFIRDADEATVEKLRTVRWFVDCGDDDRLLDYSTDFYRYMRDRKVKCELRVRNGIHCWEYWRGSLRMALPFASRNFGEK